MRFEYKIRSKKNGLFSSGTMHIKWTKNGKTWSSMGALKNHLQYDIKYTKAEYDEHDAEIIEIEIKEVVQLGRYSVSELAQKLADKKAAEEAERKQQILNRQLAYHKQQYEALQKQAEGSDPAHKSK